MRLGRDGRIGATLGSRWRLDRKIGSGGVATVFAGTDLREGRAVAIKLLHDDLSDDQEVRRRFLREGVVVNRIDHPGVVHVDDAGTDGDHTYLVMDLLIGMTLKETWEAAGERLPAPDVVRYLCRVLDIVVAAHAVGVLHRDLKACNIFITESDDLRLLDFGIARLRDPNKTDENATAAGAMLGTPACMPPEQALGKWDEVDERADVFALGATAFRLLTGKPIHQASSLPELLMAVATKPARPIRSVSQSIPPALASVIDRALAFDKTARWSSAAEMLSALRDAHPGSARDGATSSDAAPTGRTAASRSSATNEWQPLSIEPTTDRMEDAADSAGPTLALQAPIPSLLGPPAGPTVLSPRARTALMPPPNSGGPRQKATLASANGEILAHESEVEEGATKRLGAEVMGEVLEAIGQTKRSKAQSATAALVAATSSPRRAGTIPMPPSIDARVPARPGAAQPPDAPRTVEMPRGPATELLEAHVARNASAPPPAPATVLLETPAPPAAATVLLDTSTPKRAAAGEDDDDLGQPTRVQRPTASPRPGAAIVERAPTSIVAPEPKPGSSRWLLLAIAVVAGAVVAWLMFGARQG